MDGQNENIISFSTPNSRHISPSQVTQPAVAAPATVEEGSRSTRRGRGVIYGRDARGRFLSKNGTQRNRPTSLPNVLGDMSNVTTGGGDFTPYIFTVNIGEDIIERIMSFMENGARGVTVLSANGWVTNVKIQTLDSTRRVVIFKAAYDLVSLSSSMTAYESGSVNNQTGGWRITIGGVGGRIFSGVLVGRLIAASQVQVVVGSFWPLVPNPPQKRYDEPNVVVVPPERQNSLPSSSSGQVQQAHMMSGPSQSQERVDKSKTVIGGPTVPSTLSFTGQVGQPDMSGSSHSQMSSNEFQTVNFSARVPNSLAFSFTVQVQQPEMRGPHISQIVNDPSQAAIVGRTTPRELAFSFRGQVQQPEPSHSHQTRKDDSQAVVVPSALASSSTGQVTQPEVSSPILTLGWHNQL
ncbi:AT-hook motif nuclear-localized protein 10 [Capsella rubella]|uniref:AT-hook motif nuclear-localized protein 10 n=1 Tax=Capsella rubella TaxID=81985 RepID=UPI000CD53199|nr:AT-hook motif nuclear-localized protein 10 [Capsella rubella]